MPIDRVREKIRAIREAKGCIYTLRRVCPDTVSEDVLHVLHVLSELELDLYDAFDEQEGFVTD